MATDGVFDALGLFLGEVHLALEPFFNLFRDERVAIGLALLLLAAAVGFGIWFCLVAMVQECQSSSGAYRGFPTRSQRFLQQP